MTKHKAKQQQGTIDPMKAAMLQGIFGGGGLEDIAKLIGLSQTEREMSAREAKVPYEIGESIAREQQMRAATENLPFERGIAERRMAREEAATGLNERELQFLQDKFEREMQATELWKEKFLGPEIQAQIDALRWLSGERVQRIEGNALAAELIRRRLSGQRLQGTGQPQASPPPDRFAEWLRTNM